MDKSIFILLANLCICASHEFPDYGDSTPEKVRSFRLFLKSKKNESGDWTDDLMAQAVSKNPSDYINLNITQSVAEWKGKRVITIRGTSNGPEMPDASSELKIIAKESSKLFFHPQCGRNIVLLHDGRIMQKIDPSVEAYSIAITNRPLKNNEMFEMQLLKRTKTLSSAIGIGLVISSSPNIFLYDYMFKSPMTWIYVHGNIYNNGKSILDNYGKNLDELRIGDTVGVMRTDKGNVHFFVNGVDQGVGVRNITSTIYGLLELKINGESAVIVENY